MKFRFGLGWQLALVLGLFVCSLVAMLFSSWTAFRLPWQEEQAREHVRDASRQRAAAAASLGDSAPLDRPHPPHELDRQLRTIAERVLANSPGLEGGFYLSDVDGLGHFLAYAFPTRPGPESPARDLRPEPPPREPPGDFRPEPPPREPPEPPDDRPDRRGPPGRH